MRAYVRWYDAAAPAPRPTCPHDGPGRGLGSGWDKLTAMQQDLKVQVRAGAAWRWWRA
ncbi:hypothetical protein [Actinotignum sanguinis]|uniref:hypothetical protein n=1 Tax=Actinotignum sanguinis TaxID=1445614 RepID=UPI00254CF7C6|nr:hypothetical protein [Actinotignum sanguinis]MDK8656804.1 hypothetical protein [Actinotignum sanguinis]